MKKYALAFALLAAPAWAQTYPNATIRFTQTGTGAVARTVDQKLKEMCISPTDFGAVADNTTPTQVAFQLAVTRAQEQNRCLYIPRGNYLLAAQITTTVPIDIYSDQQANLRFSNAASAGWLFDFRSMPEALVQLDLPGMYGPAINSSFQIPGYSSGAGWAYNLASRQGVGIHYKGGNRTRITAHYIVGFQDCVKLESTFDGTYGAKSVLNVDVHIGTMDFCVTGFSFAPGPAGSTGMYAVSTVANTVWAKYPIYVDATNETFGASSVAITGQAFTNEADGVCVYAFGNNVNTNTIDVNWCSAGKQTDSVAGTPATLTLPYLGGTGSSNATSTDCNTNTGYFTGFNNKITVGVAVGLSPSGDLPAVNKACRIRDVGVNNKVSVKYYENSQGVGIALATVVGEANYNGGVGGANYAKRQLVNFSVAALANNASQTFYAYNQLLSDGSAKPITVIPGDNTLDASGLKVTAVDNSGTNNREIVVTVLNKSGGAVTGTYPIWLEIGN